MRRSQIPHNSLPTIMRLVYTIPFQTMEPSNISVIGTEKPMEAFKSLDKNLVAGLRYSQKRMALESYQEAAGNSARK